MSTLTGEQESRVIGAEEELYSFFQRFAKPTSHQQVGIECEFFGVEKETGRALPYLGPRGIEAILCRLAATFHYEPILEEGHVIALKKGENWVTLEPGGQVELSAPPVRTIFEIEKQIETFAGELREMKQYFTEITWLSVGIQPVSRLDEIAWVPKRRYQLMAEYFTAKQCRSAGKTRGPLAHDMMKRTATNQVNLDFTDEAAALDELRLTFGITSILSAIFAHSSFSEGRPNGYLTRRVQIWNETDPERCGLLPFFLEERRSFRDYVEYLLEMPMMFIVRHEKWIPMKGIHFRKFLQKGYEGWRANWADFELHWSTAFPEARFKRCIEVRGMDAQRLPLIPSVAAFWKGILYEPEIRGRAWALVRDFPIKEILKFHQAVPREGLHAKLGKTEAWELAKELFRLACEGLKRADECTYLDRVNEEIFKPLRSPAETLLEKWEGEFGRNPQRLIRYLEI